MQKMSSVVYSIIIFDKAPKFHVFQDLVESWILGHKTEAKWKKELKMQRCE